MNAVLINHKHHTMFDLKEGPWEKLNLSKVNSARYVSDILVKICKTLSDVPKEDLSIYVIWLASEIIKFSRDTDKTDLQLVDSDSKEYLKFAKGDYIISYDRDMNADTREEISKRFGKKRKS